MLVLDKLVKKKKTCSASNFLINGIIAADRIGRHHNNLGFINLYCNWCPLIYIVIQDYIYIVIQDLRLYCNTRYTQFIIGKKKR